jgi:hypothetical protein
MASAVGIVVYSGLLFFDPVQAPQETGEPWINLGGEYYRFLLICDALPGTCYVLFVFCPNLWHM